MDLYIIHCPGVQNTSEDILSRYGQSIEGKNAVVAHNSLGDVRIARLVQTWLSVVAPHVDWQHCCEPAKVGLECGYELVSFPCPKCGQHVVTLLSVLWSCRLNMNVWYVSKVVQVPTCARESYGYTGMPIKRFQFVYAKVTSR